MGNIPILTTAAVLAGFATLQSQSLAESPAAQSAGLIVKDGILHRDGEPYRGVGANYFDLFYRVLKDGSDTSHDEGLRKLSAAGIPFDVYGNSGQADSRSISALLETTQEIAGRAGMPLFIGEFGAPRTLGLENVTLYSKCAALSGWLRLKEDPSDTIPQPEDRWADHRSQEPDNP